MSEKRTFYVADPSNYLQREVILEIRKQFPNFKIRASVDPNTDRSIPIKHVTKILNRAKPKLFQNYLQRSQTLFVDLMFNQSMVDDVEMICQAVKKMKEFPEKIRVVVFSSLLSWAETDLNKVAEINQLLGIGKKLSDENEEENIGNEEEANEDNESNTNLEIDQETVWKTDSILETRHFMLRKPNSDFENRKELEDKLAELSSINENIEVHIFYAGLIYGKEQLILKDYFKKAWMGEPLPVHDDHTLNQNKIPTIDLEFFVKSVFRILEDSTLRPENTDYQLFAKAFEKIEKLKAEKAESLKIEQTKISDNDLTDQKMEDEEHKSKNSKDEILQKESIRLDSEETFKSNQDKNNQNENQVVDSGLEGQGAEETQTINTLNVYFMFEPKILTYQQIVDLLNKHMGNGTTYLEDQTTFELPDIMLFDFKFASDALVIQLYGEEAKTLTENMVLTTKAFCQANNLKPVRIVMNNDFRYSVCVAKALSEHYKIPLIDVTSFIGILKNNSEFLKIAENFIGEEQELFQTISKDKKSLKRFLFEKNSESSKMVFSMLKYRLNLNDCRFKGYVLWNIENVFAAFDLTQLFYNNEFSASQFEKNMKTKNKKFLKQIEKQKKENEKQEKKKIKLKLKEEKLEMLRKKQEERKKTAEAQKKEDVESGTEEPKMEESDEKLEENESVISETGVDEDQAPSLDEIEPEEIQETEIEVEDETEPGSAKIEPFFASNFVLLTQNKQLSVDSMRLFEFATKKNGNYYLKTIDLEGEAEDKKTPGELGKELTDELRIYIERVCLTERKTQ